MSLFSRKSLLPLIIMIAAAATSTASGAQATNVRAAIDQVAALATNKDKELQKALNEARHVRHAIKANKFKQKEIDRVITALDKAAKSTNVEQKKAIKNLTYQLSRVGKACPSRSSSSREQCKDVTVITTLPYTITASGFYCLGADAILAPTTITTPAITVTANNVDIDLADHVILLNTLMPGISATDVSNLSIHDGTIQAVATSTNANSNAILLSGDSYVSLENLILLNTNVGVNSGDSTDVLIFNCKFAGEGSDGVLVPADTTFLDLIIDSCEFTDPPTEIAILGGGENFSVHETNFSNASSAGIAITPDSTVSNVEVSDCDFYNCNATIILGSATGATQDVVSTEIRNCRFSEVGAGNASGILFQNGEGLLVENCAFQSATANTVSLLSIVSSSTTAVVQDALVRSCTFSNAGANANFNTIIIGSAQGVILEDCVVDANPSAGANVAVLNTNGSVASSDTSIRSCVIRGASIGIYCHGAVSVEIDSCLIEENTQDGVLLFDTHNSVVKNSTITTATGGSGIGLTNGSSVNTIFNNSVQGHFTGILLDTNSPNNNVVGNIVTDNGGDGIYIGSGTNTIIDNKVDRNGANGISNGGSNNNISGNTACNNTTTNCISVPNAQTPGSSPVVVGSNTCC
ncbi:MAG: right-handed parallel beta-helix repeat-containing protein [Verrucomicrobia bacterium]|nr:right-handed parallel beta-helix repeat-containing protein [Verrucomicrobiota bacterium]